MTKGYLLIKLVPGLEGEALPQIRATQGVVDVTLVFGQGVQDTTTLLEAEL
jgi:nitrate reductase NapAB chaperone NapD